MASGGQRPEAVLTLTQSTGWPVAMGHLTQDSAAVKEGPEGGSAPWQQQWGAPSTLA